MRYLGIYKYIRAGRFDWPVIEDWIAATSAGFLDWVATVASGGAATIVNSEDNNQGIVALNTGTTNNATGRAALSLGSSRMQLGNKDIQIEYLVRLPVLSTPTEEYFFQIGLGDNTGAGVDNTDGIYFVYNNLVDGVNWQARTSDNSVRTNANSGATVVANVFTRLRIYYDSTNSQVEFSVDGVVVATINTTLPTAAGRQLSPLFKIGKNAPATNVSRSAQVDWTILEFER